METPSPLPSDKPGWLRKLEEESWQAELIISGLAIYSSLQLPGLVEWAMEWSLANVSLQFMPFLYLFFTYFGMGSYILIFVFIGHFVLRAFWIGLVGLNSVFPRSINMASSYYSKHFLEKFEADSPDPNERIHQLDKLCSVLFAGGAQILMIFLAINIDILIIAGLRYLLGQFMEDRTADIIMYTVIAVSVVPLFLVMLTNIKSLRDRAWVKRWQYPIYKISSFITMHIFARPASQLAMTFQTNLSIKRYTGYVFGFMILVGVAFIIRYGGRTLIAFTRPEILYETYDRSDRLVPAHYATLRDPDQRLFSLELESDRITDDFLRVFVPVLEWESEARDSLCGVFTPSDDLSRQERRAAIRSFSTDCYQRRHSFYVNDSLYHSPDLVKYEHPNQGEDGILVYLPTAGFQVGKNVLRVEKNGGVPGSTMRTMQAVFWYEPRSGPDADR